MKMKPVYLVLESGVIQGSLHVEAVRLQVVLGLDSIPLSLVLVLELLGVVDHPFDVLLRESALVVGDGDFVLLPGRLVHSRNVQNA